MARHDDAGLAAVVHHRVGLTGNGDPAAALRSALHTRGPMLIHARIDPHEQVLPMVAPGGANKDMIGG